MILRFPLTPARTILILPRCINPRFMSTVLYIGILQLFYAIHNMWEVDHPRCLSTHDSERKRDIHTIKFYSSVRKMKLWLCRKVDVTGVHYVQWDKLDAERQILHFYLSHVQTVDFNLCVVERTEVIKAERGPWGRWENKLLKELRSEE